MKIPNIPEKISVVAYRVYVDCNGDGKPDGAGSATAIGPRHFQTADHVLKRCPDGAFVVISDSSNVRRVEIFDRDESRDLAVLAVNAGEPESHVWARRGCDLPRLGDRVMSYVGDADIPMFYKELIVSGVSTRALLLSGHIVGGNSGGGVFDASGCLLGVLTQGDRSSVSVEFWGVASRL